LTVELKQTDSFTFTYIMAPNALLKFILN